MLLRLTILLFVPTLLSGIGLIGVPQNEAQGSAALAWLHVAVGWVGLPVFVAFAAHHAYRRWRRAVQTRRRSGSVGLVILFLLLFSGVEIGGALSSLPASLAGWVHLLTTLALLAFLVVHLSPVLRRRLRGPSRPRSG
jgi:hypothetical protein